MNNNPISQQLAPLIAVQDYDNQLEDLRRERERWPEAIEAQQRELASLDQRRQDLDGRRQELQMEHDRLHLEAREEFTRIQNYEKHIREIKTNREYQALLREVGISKKAKADAEEAAIRVLGDVETLQAEIATLDDEIAAAREKLASLEADFASGATEIDARIAEIEAQRKDQAAGISGPILSRYQLVRKRHTNVLVRAENGACSGCHRSLPPQTFNRVLRDTELMTCPYCHRILLPPAAAVEATAAEAS